MNPTISMNTLSKVPDDIRTITRINLDRFNTSILAQIPEELIRLVIEFLGFNYTYCLQVSCKHLKKFINDYALHENIININFKLVNYCTSIALTNWLLETKSSTPQYVIRNLAKNGKLDIIKNYHSIAKNDKLPFIEDDYRKQLYEYKWTLSAYTDVAHFAVINGHLPIIEWIYEQSPECLLSEKLCEIAIQNGNIDVIMLLHLKHPTYNWSKEEYIEIAVKYGSLEVLKWIYEQYSISNPDYDLGDDLWSAVEYGHLEVLKWINSKIHEYDWSEQDYIRLAIQNGHLEVLKWLHSQIPEYNWVENDIKLAITYGHLEVLKWIEDKSAILLADEIKCEIAVEEEHINILQWICSKNPQCNLTKNTYGYAISAELNEIIQYIYMHFQSNILLNPHYIEDLAQMCTFAIEYYNLDALKYIRVRNVQYPWSDDMVDNIIETIVGNDGEPDTPEKKNRIEIFKFIYTEDRNINPIKSFARWARIDLIKWVFDQNINRDDSWKDNEGYCIEAVEGGSLEVLQFLHENKCPLHKTKCIITAENKITEWKDSHDFAENIAETMAVYENIIKWINSLEIENIIDSDVGEERDFISSMFWSK